MQVKEVQLSAVNASRRDGAMEGGAGGGGSMEYTLKVVSEAFKFVVEGSTRGGECSFMELKKVVRACIHRVPEESEVKFVEKRVREQANEDRYTIMMVATAIHECTSMRPLLPRDHLFALAHGNQNRTTVLQSMERWVGYFKCINCLIVPLTLLAFGAAIAERTMLGMFTETVGVAVCSALLFVCSVVGLIGASRLKEDLQTDDDGKETCAQRSWRFTSGSSSSSPSA